MSNRITFYFRYQIAFTEGATPLDTASWQSARRAETIPLLIAANYFVVNELR
jgi:hypothetical protein